MKKINIENKIVDVDSQPLIIVTGHELYRNKLTHDLLTNSQFYSKKYGRIIYIGEKKYRSNMIIQDETNWREKITYEEIIDLLDEAKKDEIINLLIVFYPKEIKNYEEMIEKLIGVRFTYLKGIISVMLSIPIYTSIKKTLFQKFNTIFYVDSEYISEIAAVFEIKQNYEEKRKKDSYVIGKGKIQVYKEIKD